MASLKEVKNRINSVKGTRKITSAMKLVASSKLHRAQAAIQSMLPYENQLSGMMARFVGEMQGEISSPYAVANAEVKRVVILAISSNSSLCGAFNSNVTKEVEQTIKQLRSEGVSEIEVLPIGVKIADKVKKLGFTIEDNHSSLLDKPSYVDAMAISSQLMERFVAHEIDKVILIYNHFKNTASQVLTKSVFLPVDLSDVTSASKSETTNGMALDYIIEPSPEEIVQQLIPKVLHLKVFTALLDSLASEHSARVVAMQVATDNADELLNQLTLTYNKTRQAAITSELLDIVGATFQ